VHIGPLCPKNKLHVGKTKWRKTLVGSQPAPPAEKESGAALVQVKQNK
jgi:hypothetical protein